MIHIRKVSLRKNWIYVLIDLHSTKQVKKSRSTLVIPKSRIDSNRRYIVGVMDEELYYSKEDTDIVRVYIPQFSKYYGIFKFRIIKLLKSDDDIEECLKYLI